MMRWLTDAWFRVRAVFSRRDMERDLEDEFVFHVEMEAKKLEAAGLRPDEALRTARLRFGGSERFKEAARESWGVSAVTDWLGDVRFAARQLLKHPGFSALAVATLALGIGGTVALFSVVNSVILRPLPLEAEGEVVVFWMDYNWRGEEFDYVSDYATAFESLAAFSNEAYTLRTDAGSSLVLATVSSVELFDVLGVTALLGRTFEAGEDRPGAEPVVVLGHGIWEREFASDRDVVGRRINLDGTPTTVVGVMPEDFYFPSPDMEVFLPLRLDPADRAYANNGWLVLAGRVRDRATAGEVQDNLGVIARALDERYDYPDAFDKTRNPYVTPVREYLLGDIRPVILLLFSAVAVLLLMACANVSALILTTTADRTREMSIRAALGAGRGRLARQMLTESLLLAAAAGTFGVALALGSFDALKASLPVDPGLLETIRLDWTVLIVGLAIAAASGALIALAPIRDVLRGELAGSTFSDRGAVARDVRTGATQRTLVVAEVLLAMVLVTGTSLLMRTVEGLRSIDLGLEPEGVMTVNVLLSEQSAGPAERADFLESLVEGAEALPGVQAAGLINRLPLRDGGYRGPVRIAGRPDLEGASRPQVMYRPVSPRAFEVLGARLLEGRAIRATDGPEGPLVAVISESFARRIWGDESPLGRTYQTGFVGTVEVVGVVEDISVESMTGEQPMVAYYPWTQAEPDTGGGILLVKSEGAAAALAAPLRQLVNRLEPRAVIGRMQSMEDALEAEMVEPLRLRFFLGLFSLLGLVMGSVGVYGVVSYSVYRRRAEFGVRLALGAKPNRLLGTVVGQGMVPVILGIVAGTGVALLASPTLSSFLFEVEPTDPESLVAAAAVLFGAGIVAAIVPAIRASLTDPAIALRAD